MTRRLIRTGIQDSTYERPEQAWVCGRAADGPPCRSGPDPKGRCVATSECTPHKHGDRWYCARPDAYGGWCQEGPLPEGACAHPIRRCQPQRSWRAKRGRLTTWAVMATAGLVALLLGGSSAQEMASPGPLTAAHSTSARACSDCHAPPASAEPLLSAALLFQAGTQDSSRCVVCHEMGAAAGAPHGVDPAWLEERHQEPAIRDGGGPGVLIRLAALARPRGAAARGELACATCHQEHQGRDHAITAMADRSCQVCHQVRFDGFPDGHPEFGRVKRRHTGMSFDHQTHKDTHFGDAEFTCARCHQEDNAGRAMVLKSFAHTCAGCHQQGNLNHHGAKITSGTPLTMIQLPLLNWAEGGHWSENAGVAEEELPPMIHLLLAGDDAALEPLRSLADDGDGIAVDWEPDDEDIEGPFEEALKRLVRDLVSGDEAALRLRVGVALGAAADAPEVATFVEQLVWSRFAMRAYQRAWLPGLGDGGTADNSSPEAQGWRHSDGDVAVVYRASGHADPLLSAWIDALALHVSDTAATDADDDAALRADIRYTVFTTLSSKKAGGYVYGACLRCHSVEQTATGPRVNWVAAGREAQAAGYAKFGHTTHLTAVRTDQPCFACHQLKPAEGEVDLAEVSRAFMPHRKAQCLECHSPGLIQQQCLTCHEYHLHRALDMMPAGAGQSLTLARSG